MLQFLEATINLASIDFLRILDSTYVIERILSSFVMFRSNFLDISYFLKMKGRNLAGIFIVAKTKGLWTVSTYYLASE